MIDWDRAGRRRHRGLQLFAKKALPIVKYRQPVCAAQVAA